LVSYADMFVSTEQRIVTPEAAAGLVKLNKVLDETVLEEEMETMHVTKNRLGGRHRQKHERVLHDEGYTVDLASILFRSNDRRLKDNSKAHGFATAAHKKASKKFKKEKNNKDKKNKDKDPEPIQGKTNNNDGELKKKKFLPKIEDMTPSRGDKIASSQTFSAKITPSSFTASTIVQVKFRLVDPTGKPSEWLPVPPSSDDRYEITIEGFDSFPSSKWKYQMFVNDDGGRSLESPHVMFKVDEAADSATQYDDYTEEKGLEEDETDLMKLDIVGDSNWPYGGGIQSATGRILFEFDGSGTYVCSGTVVKDDEVKGRSVILVGLDVISLK
jgi:hypothetical protein